MAELEEFLDGDNVYIVTDGSEVTAVYAKPNESGDAPAVVICDTSSTNVPPDTQIGFETKLGQAGYVPVDLFVPLDSLYELADPTDLESDSPCAPCECGSGVDEDEPKDTENDEEITERMIAEE